MCNVNYLFYMYKLVIGYKKKLKQKLENDCRQLHESLAFSKKPELLPSTNKALLIKNI